MNSCDIFQEAEKRIQEGQPIDDLIPYNCEAMPRDDYIRILALYMTYGADEARRAICREKWEHETRG